jgi:broad specificity phosphatase PhoE
MVLVPTQRESDMNPALTRWWWIRHAPVPDGGRIYGQRDLDCDCSDATVFAALALALPDDAIWVTSHLQRTKQTATAIRAAMQTRFDVEPRALADLAEQHLGDWQGLDRHEFFANRKSERHPHWFGPASERAPNGESFNDVCGRVAKAIEALSAEHAGRDIVAVTHGGTIRAALAHALRIDGEEVLSYAIDNCSLTRIDRSGGEPGEYRWRAVTVNQRPATR